MTIADEKIKLSEPFGTRKNWNGKSSESHRETWKFLSNYVRTSSETSHVKTLHARLHMAKLSSMPGVKGRVSVGVATSGHIQLQLLKPREQRIQQGHSALPLPPRESPPPRIEGQYWTPLDNILNSCYFRWQTSSPSSCSCRDRNQWGSRGLSPGEMASRV